MARSSDILFCESVRKDRKRNQYSRICNNAEEPKQLILLKVLFFLLIVPRRWFGCCLISVRFVVTGRIALSHFLLFGILLLHTLYQFPICFSVR